MKRRFYLYIGLFTAIILVSACKKYGYEFENGYDKPGSDSAIIQVDTSGYGVDKSLYAKASVFPGLVSESEVRIQDTSLNLDFGYTPLTAWQLTVSVVPLPIFSTGLYAAAGEQVRIDVPPGIMGLTVQVGSHTDDLSSVIPARRDPKISTIKALFPGINYVRNLYGGYIWLKAALPITSSVALKFKNVVRAPDFILGTTTDITAWKTRVLGSGVPWLELRAHHIAFSVSRESVVNGIGSGSMDNIDLVMAEWDKIITGDIYGGLGLIANAPEKKNLAPVLPERAVLDVQPLGAGVHNGQPIVAQNNNYWFNEWTDLIKLQSGNADGTFRQLGLNYQQANNVWWTGMVEAGSNLFAYKTAGRNNKLPLLSGYGDYNLFFPAALNYAINSKGKYFDKDLETQNTLFKVVPLLQIFNKLSNPATGENGWGFMAYLFSRARNAAFWNNSDLSKRNFFFTALCDFAQKDCSSFFDAWGIPVSTITRSNISKKYPPLSKAIWTYDPISLTGGDGPVPSRIYQDRVNWFISANTEEKVREGNNGFAANVLDGDPESFWHTQWSPAPSDPPYILTVDMQQANMVNGFYLESRRGGTRPKSVEIAVSSDGISYTNVLAFDMENINNRQYFKLNQAETFRYFKITMTSRNWGGDINAAMAEIGTFYDN